MSFCRYGMQQYESSSIWHIAASHPKKRLN